ncbi:hypothetical protein Rruber_02664 [Rhodococcus ruber]|uniref:DUF7620 family protein n=1 Tax=Rhodococcus ruber TaxID=1830 RepID=UPI0033678305
MWWNRKARAIQERRDVAEQKDAVFHRGRNVVDPLVDRAELSKHRNHFGESIERAMARKRRLA